MHFQTKIHDKKQLAQLAVVVMAYSVLALSLLRVINVKIPLQPHKKYDITQYGELEFS